MNTIMQKYLAYNWKDQVGKVAMLLLGCTVNIIVNFLKSLYLNNTPGIRLLDGEFAFHQNMFSMVYLSIRLCYVLSTERLMIL